MIFYVLAILGGFLIALALGAAPAGAHNLGFTEVRVSIEGDSFGVDVYCDLDALALGVDASADSAALAAEIARSEERRVGKECIEPCRSRWSPYH